MDSMGAAVVVGNVHETHNQQLLRSHDEEINVLAMSNTGALLASAQVCSKRRQVHRRIRQSLTHDAKANGIV